MAELVLGPMLRYADEHRATVWVETDEPCRVTVLGHTTRTFTVEDHHYALVRIEDLEPGTTSEYDVRLDDERVWPADDDPWPAPVIRTRAEGSASRLAFGSCRAAAPQQPPWSLDPDEDPLGLGPDALLAYAHRMRDCDHDDWPDALLLLGDQVYADDASPRTRAYIRTRRDTSQPPGEEVADFQEYTQLYLEAWSEPGIRWLLSTVPTAMIFDDHDVTDDWNISAAWVAEMRATDWWEERIVGAFMSYWIYQHLGNLEPEALDADETVAAVTTGDDPSGVLRQFAKEADARPEGSRWSYDRDLGAAHLVVIDSRAGRVLDEGRRDMLDPDEWEWLEEQMREPTSHLLLATSLPILLPRSFHDAERWNAHLCSGAWGAAVARSSEKLRRAVDLEHWAAFQTSFLRLIDDIRGVAVSADAPRSILMLGGDVHHAYLAEAKFPEDITSAVWQVVASPLRQSVPTPVASSYRTGRGPAGRGLGRLLSGAARLPDPPLEWTPESEAIFNNHIATIEIDQHHAVVRLERAVGTDGPPRLETLVERQLT